jgi:hypothetical protein
MALEKLPVSGPYAEIYMALETLVVSGLNAEFKKLLIRCQYQDSMERWTYLLRCFQYLD